MSCPVNHCRLGSASGGAYPDGLCQPHAERWVEFYGRKRLKPDQLDLDAWLRGDSVPSIYQNRSERPI